MQQYIPQIEELKKLGFKDNMIGDHILQFNCKENHFILFGYVMRSEEKIGAYFTLLPSCEEIAIGLNIKSESDLITLLSILT